MKIVVDLQCCQTKARDRGMGRYSLALAKALVEQGRDHRFLFLLNGRLLASSASLVAEIESWDAVTRIIAFDHPGLEAHPGDRDVRDQIANVLRNDRVETVCPDVYHVSSLYEGDSIVGPAAPYISLPRPPIITSATFYDLIPSLYPDRYLDYPPTARWYRRTMAAARGLDMLLAISDATKRDAERILGARPDNVVNILGGVGDEFQILPGTDARRGRVWQRIDPARPFLLYVGGPDFRKNVVGAFRGFTAAAKRLPTPYTFVFVLEDDSEPARQLLYLAAEAGLTDHVVVTGFIEDRDLVELYNACTLFVFPSLYEGLGLPVIEAMKCGAPVLVGDNSSLVEIVPEPQYRFDANDASAIGDALFATLGDPGRLDRMRDYSRERAATFSWASSARRALDAWEDRYRRVTSERRPGRRLPRVAMFSPLPTEKTGIADYMADFLPSLSAFATIEVFVEDRETVSVSFDGVRISHHAGFAPRAETFDVVVYQIGNSPYHHYMLPYIERHPGIVVLHDAYLGYLTHDWGRPDILLRQALEEAGPRARSIIERSADKDAAARSVIDLLSCGGLHVERSHGVIVHSHFARTILADASNAPAAPEIRVVPQYRAAIPPGRRADKATARRRLGLAADAFTVATFGHVASTKGILELIAGFRKAAGTRPGWRLVLVGELEGGPDAATPYAQGVLAEIRGRDDISITGFVDQETYDLWLAAIDVGVQLRTISRGETSGAMLNLLMNGVPFVFNRMGAASELPDDVAIGLVGHDADDVADALSSLASDDAHRSALGAAALAYSARVLDPRVVAETFVQAAVEMTARSRACGGAAVAGEVARLLSAQDSPGPILSETAAAYVRQERSEARPRLLIDVTQARSAPFDPQFFRDADLLRQAFRKNGRRRPQAVTLAGDRLAHADDLASAVGASLRTIEPVRHGTIDLRCFDRLLFPRLPSEWTADHARLLSRLRDLGGSAYGIVDDVSPFVEPKGHPSRLADAAEAWLRGVLETGGGIVCRDAPSARDLAHAVGERRMAVQGGFRIGVIERPSSPERVGTGSSPTGQSLVPTADILVVGPIAAGYGQPAAIEAADRLRALGTEMTLGLLRWNGWDDVALLRRIEAHPAFGTRIVDLGVATPLDLDRHYEGASALLVLSDDGMLREPIARALAGGLPIIAADSAALRRRIGDAATFVEPTADGVALAMRAVARHGRVRHHVEDTIGTKEAVAGLLDFIDGAGGTRLPARH